MCAVVGIGWWLNILLPQIISPSQSSSQMLGGGALRNSLNGWFTWNILIQVARGSGETDTQLYPEVTHSTCSRVVAQRAQIPGTNHKDWEKEMTLYPWVDLQKFVGRDNTINIDLNNNKPKEKKYHRQIKKHKKVPTLESLILIISLFNLGTEAIKIILAQNEVGQRNGK